MSPKTKLTVYVCWAAVTFVAFFAIRFDVVYYRDTRIVCWGTTDSFLKESKDVIVLGNYTLATEYGPVYLNWFCDIHVISKNVSGITIGEKSSHNLKLLGQDVGQGITVTFDNDRKIGTLSGGQNSFSFGFNTFTYSIIYLNGSSRKSLDEILVADIVFDRIVLDDGTEIVFSDGNSYDLCLDVKESEWIITIIPPSGIDLGIYYFFVKRPGEQEHIKYSEVRFEPYWGSFLEGTVFQEPVEDQQTEKPAEDWWFSY